ncbi:hypothetical protein L373_00886 [Klebsiella michiganensis]|uniref:Uncharacterized protein n=1 Tax=Klebsiella michiganensis TaxID=1134687 RepID=A0A7H5AF95_9ENTR|nr:hypothetical protein HMPREF9686_04734 [Klebsiella michiganensis]EWF92590.1 hypothetical protein L373_00886 [Klebsiella michiganensis]SBL19139.1 Uncharacterised protein [Klebsiella michiganensis]
MGEGYMKIFFTYVIGALFFTSSPRHKSESGNNLRHCA